MDFSWLDGQMDWSVCQWPPLRSGMPKLQPTGSVRPSTASTVTVPCPTPSGWQLCPIAQQQPSHQHAINIVQDETRAQRGCNALLTQVKANNCMHYDTLAEHCPMNSRKYAAGHSVVWKEFENRFQNRWKNYQFFLYIFATLLSFNTNTFFKWKVQGCDQIFNSKARLCHQKNTPCFTVTLYPCHHLWQCTHLRTPAVKDEVHKE